LILERLKGEEGKDTGRRSKNSYFNSPRNEYQESLGDMDSQFDFLEVMDLELHFELFCETL
jgi:hypothetical protein